LIYETPSIRFGAAEGEAARSRQVIDIHEFGHWFEWGSSPPPSAVRLRGLVGVTRLPQHRCGFALETARYGGPFLCRYCPISATELFSMCSRIPGQIEPVFS